MKVTGVTVDPKTYTLDFGAKFTLKAIVAPANADDKTVTWTSDMPAVVAVDAATGEVTGLAEGDATVTAKTKDGDFTASAVVTVNPKPVTYPITGKAGALDWSLEQNGTLTVSGQGAIPDYGAPTGGTRSEMVVPPVGAAPWKVYAGEIKVIVIVQGVTAIGTGAFAGLEALTSVTLPESVESIGAGAFAGCVVLVEINIAEGTDVGEGAFTGCVALPEGAIPPPLNVLDKIPDAAFRAFIEIQMGMLDTNGDGVLSKAEATGLTSIYMTAGSVPLNIASLEGLEYFTELDYLVVETGSNLAPVDLSKNTKLLHVGLSNNNLTSLDVSMLTELNYLNCAGNPSLGSLDVSKNTRLTTLRCSNCNLSSLDVSKNTELTLLWCSNNKFATLDVSKNTALTDFDCDGNQLTAIDVSKNTALTHFDCHDNQLTALDVSNNTELTFLSIMENSLSSLDVSNNTELTFLNVEDNRLTGIDISNNTKLTNFYCSFNPGDGKDFSVRVWFDEDNVPAGFPPAGRAWGLGGKTIHLKYVTSAGFDGGGVTIGGVTWATSNVHVRGEFEADYWNFGGQFVWSDPGLDRPVLLAQHACPDGWRLPTIDEFKSLGTGTRTVVKVNDPVHLTNPDPLGGYLTVFEIVGYTFGSGDNTIFLPCGGWNHRHHGNNQDRNYGGYYHCQGFNIFFFGTLGPTLPPPPYPIPDVPDTEHRL